MENFGHTIFPNNKKSIAISGRKWLCPSVSKNYQFQFSGLLIKAPLPKGGCQIAGVRQFDWGI
jgi:hypothetical protein